MPGGGGPAQKHAEPSDEGPFRLGRSAGVGRRSVEGVEDRHSGSPRIATPRPRGPWRRGSARVWSSWTGVVDFLVTRAAGLLGSPDPSRHGLWPLAAARASLRESCPAAAPDRSIRSSARLCGSNRLAPPVDGGVEAGFAVAGRSRARIENKENRHFQQDLRRQPQLSNDGGSSPHLARAGWGDHGHPRPAGPGDAAPQGLRLRRVRGRGGGEQGHCELRRSGARRSCPALESGSGAGGPRRPAPPTVRSAARRFPSAGPRAAGGGLRHLRRQRLPPARGSAEGQPAGSSRPQAQPLELVLSPHPVLKSPTPGAGP